MDTYPLPLVQAILASLANGQSFTKLDLAHAYQQLTLDEDSRKYTKCTMESLLRDLPHVCIYLDDILVTGESEAAHLQKLAAVLEQLEAAGIRLKREKCAFMIPEVEYLGHSISAEGCQREGACGHGGSSTSECVPVAIIPWDGQLLCKVPSQSSNVAVTAL